MAGKDTRKKLEQEIEAGKEQGDVLGISRSPGRIPQATRDHGGHPRGIDVRKQRHGSADVHQGPGATSIDMGAGGEGNAIEREDEE